MILIKFNWTVKKGNGIRLFKNVKEEKQKGRDERERERERDGLWRCHHQRCRRMLNETDAADGDYMLRDWQTNNCRKAIGI